MPGVLQPPIQSTSPAVPGAVPDRAADYQERKLDRRCTRYRCKAQAVDGSQLCKRHGAADRKANASSHRRLRRERRDAGLCACGCGQKSPTWLAPSCAIRLGRVPRSAVPPAVPNRGGRSGGVWRDDADGWNRFRGRGRRGAPPAGANDESDLRMILVAIQRGTEGLAYARSPAVQQLGRISRQAALNESAALFAHAARGLDDLVERLRKGR